MKRVRAHILSFLHHHSLLPPNTHALKGSIQSFAPETMGTGVPARPQPPIHTPSIANTLRPPPTKTWSIKAQPPLPQKRTPSVTEPAHLARRPCHPPHSPTLTPEPPICCLAPCSSANIRVLPRTHLPCAMPADARVSTGSPQGGQRHACGGGGVVGLRAPAAPAQQRCAYSHRCQQPKLRFGSHESRGGERGGRALRALRAHASGRGQGGAEGVSQRNRAGTGRGCTQAEQGRVAQGRLHG